MPTYPYECANCSTCYDVTKRVAEIDDPAFCPSCGDAGMRTIGRTHFYGASDWDKAEFNPAFGQVVRNKTHQREILRKFADQGKVFEDVGNEPVENLHKHFDGEREARLKARWSDPNLKGETIISRM